VGDGSPKATSQKALKENYYFIIFNLLNSDRVIWLQHVVRRDFVWNFASRSGIVSPKPLDLSIQTFCKIQKCPLEIFRIARGTMPLSYATN
jgi:hypothetical protein